MLGRIDTGDAEDVAHRRIGRRAAPLAQDRRIAAAREIDDVLDGEEIAGEIELGDQRQFARQRGLDTLGHPVRIAPRSPGAHFAFEEGLRGLAVGVDFFRILVAQFIEAEAAPVSDLARGGNRVRPAGEQALHGGRAFEVPLGIGVEQVPGARDRGLVPDRGHHVLQRAAFGRVVVDVVGGE